jgi:hypothetical protein
MEFSPVSLDEVQATSIRTLGLDDRLFVLEYPEAIAASLRRAASFLCPTTPRALVDAVLEVLTPVLAEPPKREDLMELVDQLISTGDLLELIGVSEDRKARLLYLGPPSFVEKSPGCYLLTGVRPLAAPLVGDDIEIEYVLHTRTTALDPATGEGSLRASGLHKVNRQQWTGQPSVVSAAEFFAAYTQRLGVARAAGFVDGLTIIDPATKPRYYRGRWREPGAGDTGTFVGRRPQAYGADAWCVVSLVDGAPDRLIDLPLDSAATPARDEAWRLQAGIDAVNGTPLVYRVRPMPDAAKSESLVDFFSPLPTWAERYLELVGYAMDKSPGALFAYRVPDAALPALRSVLTETLWMKIVNE